MLLTRRLQAGDLDGLLALGLNNLIQILLIISLCRGVLGFPDTLLFGTVLPAAGISLLLGNLAYARQARVLAQQEHRQDCTALPYGINTVSLFAFVFLVMLPVKLAALNAGLSEADAVTRAWQVGLMACLGSGLIETFGAFCAHSLRRWLPRAQGQVGDLRAPRCSGRAWCRIACGRSRARAARLRWTTVKGAKDAATRRSKR